MKKLFAIILILFFSAAGLAQQKKDAPADTLPRTALHIIVHNYGDSVVVRWAPGNSISWLLLQKNGVILKRMAFTKNQKNVYTLTDSSSINILPWALNEWADNFKLSHDTSLAMAAQILYGKTLNFNNGKQGNSMSAILDKYNEQQNRFGFALMLSDFDPLAATGFGFRYVDKNIRKDHYYMYSIYPAEEQKQIKIDTARILINGAQKDTVGKFPGITGVAGDKVINLFWPATDQPVSYSGYIIERSEDGKNFSRLSQLPFVSFDKEKSVRKPVQYVDSVAANYKTYYYRVTGITAFADHSSPSPVLKIMAIDLTAPAAPVITEIKNTVTGKIYFKWNKNLQAPDFKGYVVGRSSNLKGPFEPISKGFLPDTVHEFTDEHPSAIAPNYYMVAAVDTAGNAGRSEPAYMNIEDHIAPAAPIGLTGNIDTAGHVIIHWNWNKEEDLAGYKIFFANAPDHAFTPLTGDLLSDTLFTDSISIETLSKKIYYKVIAYDRVMNASPFSELLVLNKPDIIPPMAAVIHKFNVTDSSIVISWYASVSSDAATQNLFRKKDSADWQLMATLPASDTSYSDNKTAAKHLYSYSIETIDSSGLSSGKSFPVNVFQYDKGYSGVIKNFEVVTDSNNQQALLKWMPPGENVSYYILFKDANNGGFKMAGTIEGSNSNFKENIDKGKYRYAIKAVYADGKESALSDIKTIEVQ